MQCARLKVAVGAVGDSLADPNVGDGAQHDLCHVAGEREGGAGRAATYVVGNSNWGKL